MDWESLREHAMETDRKLRQFPHLHRAKHFLDVLLLPVLVVLVAVLYLEFFAHLSHAQHEIVLMMEKGIFFYFVAELGVDFIIYEERRSFFHDRWFDILLILPFLTLFRSFNAVLRAFTGLRFLKWGKAAKTAKTLQAAKGAKALKTAKTTKAGKAAELGETARATKAVKNVSNFQKVGKAVTKAKHIIHDVFE